MTSEKVHDVSTFEHRDVASHNEKTGYGTDIGHVERTLTEELGKKDHMDYDRIDKEVAKYASDTAIFISEEENIRLRKLVDRRVLFVMIITYFLQAIDKGTLSFSSIMGIRTDTNLVGQQYSWLTTCIYIAILVVEYPTNWILQRVPIGKYLAFNIITWSVMLGLHALAKSFTHLVVLRTLLGIFEAACQPTFVVLSSMWYKREEQASRITYWYMMNGAQQIVGGLLAYCFSLIKSGPLKSWQVLFLTYACISICWGFFVAWYMPDSPMKAKCYSEEDKKLMVERVRSNQTGMQNKVFRKEQVWEALTDPTSWCYCMIQICTTLPTSGLGAFYNIIVASLGFTVLETQLLAMVLGAYIIIVLLSSNWLVGKYNQNLIVMICYVLPSFAGTIILMTVKNSNNGTKALLLLSYYVSCSFWAAQTIGLSMVSRNTGGQTKKTVVVTMTFVSWAAGNAIGPQVFLSWNGPGYHIAFATHLGCYSALVLTLIFLRFYLKAQNKKRDELAAAGLHEANDADLVHGFDDLTDKENLNFRYIY